MDSGVYASAAIVGSKPQRSQSARNISRDALDTISAACLVLRSNRLPRTDLRRVDGGVLLTGRRQQRRSQLCRNSISAFSEDTCSFSLPLPHLNQLSHPDSSASASGIT